MKTTRALVVVLGLLALTANVWAQISLDTAGSRWGGSNLFYSDGQPTPTYRTDLAPGAGTAYAAVLPDTNGYVFGFANSTPTGTSSYNLGSTSLTAGTTLHIVLSGFSAVPNYIAYTGGALTNYSYSGGVVTMDVSTLDPVPTFSDPAGVILTSAFGMKIVTGGPQDFSGSVFRTDMYWGDVSGLDTAYTGTTPLTGLNAAGYSSHLATYYAYLPTAYLDSIGIHEPADAEAIVEKSNGETLLLALSTKLFAPTDPFVAGTYTYGGPSTFDFNGGGADDYGLAQFSNDYWSSGNVGLNAIPEPSTFSLLLCSLALLAVFRRRAINNARRR